MALTIEYQVTNKFSQVVVRLIASCAAAINADIKNLNAVGNSLRNQCTKELALLWNLSNPDKTLTSFLNEDV